MFRTGQKVVGVGVPGNPSADLRNTPPVNTIVTLGEMFDGSMYGIKGPAFAMIGYELTVNGDRQYWLTESFRPLDETFAEETLNGIIEKIKEKELQTA